MRARLALLAGCAAACALAAPVAAVGGTFTATDGTVEMDDGVRLGVTYYRPDGAFPPAGFPAVMIFHGIGGSRASVADASDAFAASGYAVLSFDARAHGASGGLFTLDGPRELADTRALFAWLGAKPEVDEARIGAHGVSLGGGMVWRAAVEGVPFAALEPVTTWTDLYGALVPRNLVKTGAVFQFAQAVAGRLDPSIAPLLPDLLGNRNLTAIRQLFGERSTRPRLSTLRVPTFMLQGRTDFAFDIEQAAAAFRLLAGPKRLYIGNLGHAPAPNPAAERPYLLGECVQWFDRFLKGVPNGIDTRPPVELAAAPWSGKTASYATLPPTSTVRLKLPGTRTIRGEGKIVRSVRLPARRLEAFGSPVVRMTVSGTFPHAVAVLSLGNTVVSDGGTALALSSKRKTVSFPLISTAVPLPPRARLTLTIAGSSVLQNSANVLYLNSVPAASTLKVGAVGLSLPVLRRRISP